MKKGVDSKVLVQNGQKFWVEGHEPPPPPAEFNSAPRAEQTREGGQKKEGETSNKRKKRLSSRLNICVLEQNIYIKSKIFVQSIEMKDSCSAHIDKYNVVRK